MLLLLLLPLVLSMSPTEVLDVVEALGLRSETKQSVFFWLRSRDEDWNDFAHAVEGGNFAVSLYR